MSVILLLLGTYCMTGGCQESTTCKAIGPNGEYTDLSPLTVQTTNYYTGTASTGDVFYYNICGNVTQKYCTTTSSTAVCQLSGGNQFSCGLESSQDITYINATVSSVTYLGGAICQAIAGQPKRSTLIYVVANPNIDGTITSSIIESSCSYQITMESNLIASPTCVATNETMNESMNMTGLIISAGSTYYEQSDNNGDKYYFNICGTVTDQYCKSSSQTSVCQVTASGNQFSAGKLTSQSLSLINETTSVIHYGGGDECQNYGVDRSSNIYVTYEPSISTSVVGSAIESACTYSLFVVSSQACPTGQYCEACEATNVTTGTSMNLTPLRLADLESSTFYEAETENGETFIWNICNSVTSQYCSHKPGTAVCQIVSGTQYSCGVTSTSLLQSINETTSIVSYGGGDVCSNVVGMPARSSTIFVSCNPQVTDIEFGTVIEGSCSYTLSMTTNKVCGVQNSFNEEQNAVWNWLHSLFQ